MMFALVVVVDLFKAVHERRDLFQLRGRHRHRGQGAHADGVGPEHRSDPADHAAVLQFAQTVKQGTGAGVQLPRDMVERLRFERERPLVVVQQALGQRFHAGHSPVRWARALKKMPLGLLAGRVAVFSRLAVS